MTATPRPDRYGIDTAWTMASLVVQLAAGAALTLGVYFIYGSEPLGVFNQLYAIFAVSGQLFVLGLNDSTLKHSAQHDGEQPLSDVIVHTGLLLALGGGVLGAAVIYAFAVFAGGDLLSAEVGNGLLFVAPGLAFFVVNKVIIGILNGRRQFFRFALSQALRAVCLTAAVFGVLAADQAYAYFGACFTATEIIVLLANGDVAVRALRLRRGWRTDAGRFKSWTQRQFSFGMLSMPHGFLSETFIRVDVLVLMLFLDDAAIGIYSFAAFFVEGIYQLPVLVRNITNPRLVAVIHARDKSAFRALVTKSSGLSLILTTTACAVFMAAAPCIAEIVTIPNFDVVYGLLTILLPALAVYSFSIPFDYGLLSGGRPALQSGYMLLIAVVNVAANFILIPMYGLTGAAAGTAVAMACATCILWPLLYRAFAIQAWK
jgi:O-antigen/teichoic acid export membrane protein